jgi:hypothetical protein
VFNLRDTIRVLRQLYGHTPAADFAPLAVKACLTRARTSLEWAGVSPMEMADLLPKEAWVLCRLDNLVQGDTGSLTA